MRFWLKFDQQKALQNHLNQQQTLLHQLQSRLKEYENKIYMDNTEGNKAVEELQNRLRANIESIQMLNHQVSEHFFQSSDLTCQWNLLISGEYAAARKYHNKGVVRERKSCPTNTAASTRKQEPIYSFVHLARQRQTLWQSGKIKNKQITCKYWLLIEHDL